MRGATRIPNTADTKTVEKTRASSVGQARRNTHSCVFPYHTRQAQSVVLGVGSFVGPASRCCVVGMTVRESERDGARAGDTATLSLSVSGVSSHGRPISPIGTGPIRLESSRGTVDDVGATVSAILRRERQSRTTEGERYSRWVWPTHLEGMHVRCSASVNERVRRQLGHAGGELRVQHHAVQLMPHQLRPHIRRPRRVPLGG
jgi:hypothetical protein